MDKNTPINNELSAAQRGELLVAMRARFEKHMTRHPGMDWADVQARLEAQPAKLWSVSEMERTGGEPDVVYHDTTSGEYIFMDCSPESPAGRRNLCYDREALEKRKTFKPADSALNMAAAMGIEILSEQQYRSLQLQGHFDAKTSSWILTPPEVRGLGGALFADYRYGQVFVYHNGADSYYGSRGFRGVLRV